jgi:hypothetical protein
MAMSTEMKGGNDLNHDKLNKFSPLSLSPFLVAQKASFKLCIFSYQKLVKKGGKENFQKSLNLIAFPFYSRLVISGQLLCILP